MKAIMAIFLLSLFATVNSNGQNAASGPKKITTTVKSEKHLSSSILLWMRTDIPRKSGMDRWKGPHSKIISANKGIWEYRQMHFAEDNTGLWAAIPGVETVIPQDRKIDGVSDVTLKGFLSLLRGRAQNKLAYVDEVNIFMRTILYAAFPKNSRWYSVSEPNNKIESRSMVFFRIKEGVNETDFNKFIMEELTPALANMGILKELRSKVYSPWKESQWDTPQVFHDNAKDVQYQASLILGFTDETAMDQFYQSEAVKNLSGRIALFSSAVHAYTIEETLTFVEAGEQLSH